jgi:hypothetical protein
VHGAVVRAGCLGPEQQTAAEVGGQPGVQQQLCVAGDMSDHTQPMQFGRLKVGADAGKGLSWQWQLIQAHRSAQTMLAALASPDVQEMQ